MKRWDRNCYLGMPHPAGSLLRCTALRCVLLQVKFFDFVNKAQIKAAQRLSAALEGGSGAGGEGGRDGGEGVGKEDFFHLIRAAAAQGIAQEDCGDIWAD